MMRAAVFVLAIAGAALALKDYTGYKVIEITPRNDYDLIKIKALQQHMDVWKMTATIGKPAQVLVDPTQEAQLRLLFVEEQLRVHIGNMQDNMDREQAELKSKEAFAFLPGMAAANITLNKYHTFSEIEAYLVAVNKTYPSIVSLYSVGKTHQGRDLWVLKVGSKSTSKKPGFWIDGCIHAREWIATATVVWTINELVTKYTTNSMYKEYLDKMDFYFLTVFNADGYDYTWTGERLWRKTRTGPRDGCYGVDPNRNWDYEWGTTGISRFPCSEIYDGPSAFSEPCTQAVSKYLLTNNDVIKGYMNIHSYSQDWFYPYAWKRGTYPPNKAELVKISNNAVAAIKAVHGMSYRAGTPADILYDASGSTFDWTEGKANIPYSFGMELRPTESSPYGFQLPADQIVPTAEETWAGLQEIAKVIMSLKV